MMFQINRPSGPVASLCSTAVAAKATVQIKDGAQQLPSSAVWIFIRIRMRIKGCERGVQRDNRFIKGFTPKNWRVSAEHAGNLWLG